MKYRFFYIALLLLATTPHISACEPENGKAKKQKRIKMYQCLFAKDTTNPMPEFVDQCFEREALIYDRNDGECCKFYWDPNNPMDIKTALESGQEGPNYLRMRSYNGGYEIYFKKLHKDAIQQMVHEDQTIAKKTKVKLTLDPDGLEDLIWEITPVLDDENTE